MDVMEELKKLGHFLGTSQLFRVRAHLLTGAENFQKMLTKGNQQTDH